MAYTPPRWATQGDFRHRPSPYSYGAGEPGASWRPFNSDSVWNQPVPTSPTVASDSASVISWVNSLSGPVDRDMGQGGTSADFDHPVYYHAAGGPELRFKLQSGGTDPSNVYNPSPAASKRRASAIQNLSVPYPTEATPAAGSDGHMVVMTADHSFEFIQGEIWSPGEGRVGARYGAVFPLDGDGSSVDGHACTASGVSLLSGQIRLAELQAGQINHALAIITKWSRRNVFEGPATGVASPDPTTTAGDANDLVRPVTGSRFQLNYTQSEINALSVPDWKKTILQAMREYGMIVMDTGGASWGLQFESGAVDVAQGNPDRWRAYAVSQGWSLSGGAGSPYVLPLKTGVDWTKLRVLAASNWS